MTNREKVIYLCDMFNVESSASDYTIMADLTSSVRLLYSLSTQKLWLKNTRTSHIQPILVELFPDLTTVTEEEIMLMRMTHPESNAWLVDFYERAHNQREGKPQVA